MGWLDWIFFWRKPKYHYTIDADNVDETGFVPARSIYDFFTFDLRHAPDDSYKLYRTKQSGKWKLERFHRYFDPPEADLFPESDVLKENDRIEINLQNPNLEKVDRQRLLDFVRELHENFGEDLFERTDLDEEDTRILDLGSWEEEPFWQGRRWPAFSNSPEFELRMDEMQGLVLTIWPAHPPEADA